MGDDQNASTHDNHTRPSPQSISHHQSPITTLPLLEDPYNDCFQQDQAQEQFEFFLDMNWGETLIENQHLFFPYSTQEDHQFPSNSLTMASYEPPPPSQIIRIPYQHIHHATHLQSIISPNSDSSITSINLHKNQLSHCVCGCQHDNSYHTIDPSLLNGTATNQKVVVMNHDIPEILDNYNSGGESTTDTTHTDDPEDPYDSGIIESGGEEEINEDEDVGDEKNEEISCQQNDAIYLTVVTWESERSHVYQIDVHNEMDRVILSRRADTHYINATKLLNAAGLSRGRRDATLKHEPHRDVKKCGPVNLKGVWIPLNQARNLAEEYIENKDILLRLSILFSDNPQNHIHPNHHRAQILTSGRDETPTTTTILCDHSSISTTPLYATRFHPYISTTNSSQSYANSAEIIPVVGKNQSRILSHFRKKHRNIPNVNNIANNFAQAQFSTEAVNKNILDTLVNTREEAKDEECHFWNFDEVEEE